MRKIIEKSKRVFSLKKERLEKSRFYSGIMRPWQEGDGLITPKSEDRLRFGLCFILAHPSPQVKEHFDIQWRPMVVPVTNQPTLIVSAPLPTQTQPNFIVIDSAAREKWSYLHSNPDSSFTFKPQLPIYIQI